MNKIFLAAALCVAACYAHAQEGRGAGMWLNGQAAQEQVRIHSVTSHPEGRIYEGFSTVTTFRIGEHLVTIPRTGYFKVLVPHVKLIVPSSIKKTI